MTKTTNEQTLKEAAHQEAVAQSRLQQLQGVVLSVLSSPPVRLARYVVSALIGALTGLMNMFKAAPSDASVSEDGIGQNLGTYYDADRSEAEEAAATLAAATALPLEGTLAAPGVDDYEVEAEVVSDSETEDEAEVEIEAEVPNNTVARVAAVAGTAVLTGLAAYTVFGAEDGPAGVIRAIPGIVAADAATLAGGISQGAEAMRLDAQVLLDTTVVPYASAGLKNASLLLGTLGDVAVGGLSSSLMGLGAIYGATANVMSTAADHIGDAAVLVGNKVQADATSLTTQLSNAFFTDVEAVGDALNEVARNNLEPGS
jgi:hypothetical protein